jgi:predicted transcriptional regulator
MTKKNKPKLGFDQRGGVLAVSRAMRDSCAYESMPATAKVLMDLLHMQWRNDRPVAYGVREAAKKIGCKPETACKAFKVLEARGFIVRETESLFNSKTGSKAREWRLTWMPFEYLNPTHDWEKWQP